MSKFPHRPLFDSQPNPDAIVLAPYTRFTILTSRLIRLEYSPENQFIDQPSQVFWYRRQTKPEFKVKLEGGSLTIETEHLVCQYLVSERGFTPDTLSIRLKNNNVVWRYGDTPESGGNLYGTARTLDQAGGRIQLEAGLMARQGWALVDDSETLLFNKEGWLIARPFSDNIDLYFFGYGNQYLDCLSDYYKVAGKPPLIPRWALGNWWSRYHAYTQDELMDLINDFHNQGAPLSVCIIDIDWHLPGWTGYTWNRKLVPDPKGLIQWLHGKGLRTSLNLHPADGIGPHEEMYVEFAKALNRNPEAGTPIPFDCADQKFMHAYFEVLHHPQELDGIDFWWIDWQQGELSSLPGLDPLWWLNHLHFYDLARDNQKRPFTFSRWGGLGNHRYPIGFSGDTEITWEALDFQPYFTATAANVGYGWWSHDIGGHMGGIEDDELYIRWLQFGLLSPILRLHSTKNPFHERRPWCRSSGAHQIGAQALRMRHQFIPYLYSMAWRDHNQGIPLITPLYYSHPNDEAAYQCPQAYWFGSELIAAPFTTPAVNTVNHSRQLVWLPQNRLERQQEGLQTTQAPTEGYWVHFFTGERYTGGEWSVVYGGLQDIPLFARPGAIVPLSQILEWGKIDTPESLLIHIFPGANNRFELYEDDGETNAYQDGKYAITTFSQKWTGDRLHFRIAPVAGDLNQTPSNRHYSLIIHAVKAPGQVLIKINDQDNPAEWRYNSERKELHLEWETLSPKDNLEIILHAGENGLLAPPENNLSDIFRLLQSFELDTRIKAEIWRIIPEIISGKTDLESFMAALSPEQYAALSDSTGQLTFQ